MISGRRANLVRVQRDVGVFLQPWFPNIAFHGDFGRGLGLVGCARNVLYQIVPEHGMLGTWFVPKRTCAVDVLPTWLGFKEMSACFCNLGYQTLPFTAILEGG